MQKRFRGLVWDLEYLNFTLSLFNQNSLKKINPKFLFF